MQVYVKIEFRERPAAAVPIVEGNSGMNYGVATRDPKTGRFTYLVPLEKWQSISVGARSTMKDDFASGCRKRMFPLSFDVVVVDDTPKKANAPKQVQDAPDGAGEASKVTASDPPPPSSDSMQSTQPIQPIQPSESSLLELEAKSAPPAKPRGRPKKPKP